MKTLIWCFSVSPLYLAKSARNFDHRSIPAQLDQFIESVTPEWRVETLVNVVDEVRPGWFAVVTLQQRIPLGGLTVHVEGSEEHLPASGVSWILKN